MKIRKKPLIVFTLLFLVEVYIALYVRDQFVRPYLGDVLVVFLVYSFVRIFTEKWPRFMPLFVFIFAFCVECLQLLNLSSNPTIRMIIGSTFDWKDVACYGVGAVLLFVFRKR